MKPRPKIKILALLLALCLVLGGMPLTAWAGDGTPASGAAPGAGGTITAFAELSADVAEQSVEVGTAEDELNLPDELTVTVTTGATITADVSGDDTATDSDAQEPETQETETTVDLASDQNGTGWEWYATTATLTLDSSYGGAPIAVNCGDSDTINLSYSGNVSIASGAASPIFCNGNLNISETGSGGTLTLNYTGASSQYVALEVLNELTISSGTLSATSAGSGTSPIAAVIYASQGVTITDSANVTATTTGDTSSGICTDVTGEITISTSGTVTANGTGTQYAFSAGSTATLINISSGTVALSNSDTPANLYRGMLNHTGGTLNSGASGSTTPAISLVTVPLDGTYQEGQSLDFRVYFTEIVTVTGTPYISLAIGSQTKQADYISGGGTTSHQFRYTVQSGDADADGIECVSPVELNGGTIENAGGTDAILTFTPLAASGVLVGGAPTSPAVTDETGLKAALESTTPNSNIQLGDDITMNTADITLYADHTLNTGGKTLTITGGKAIRTNGNALTINGGGTVMLANTIYHGIRGIGSDTDELNLANVTVNLEDTGTSGGLYRTNITVGNNAIINLNSTSTGNQINIADSNQTLSINPGGVVNVNHFTSAGINNSGTIHINDGALNLGTGSGNNWGILNQGGGLLKISSSGTLTPSTGAAIHLVDTSKVEGMNGYFKDRGTPFNESGQVAVGVWSTEASANSLTVGTYFWTGSVFEKNVITLTAEPQDVTVTQGAITGSLTAAGTAGNGNPVSYQWYDADYNPIADADSGSFSIPTDLTAGTYEYACALTADGCDRIVTRTVAVTVTAYSSGSGSSGSSNPPATSADSNGTITAQVGADGKATASVTASQFNDALTRAQEAAANSGNNPTVQINIGGTEGANEVATTIPGASLQALASGATGGLTLSGGLGSVTFDSGALSTISGTASGDVTFNVSQADPATLSAAVRQMVGDRPVYQFSVSSAGENIARFDGTVAVSLPYTPAPGEDTNAIIVTYINADGNLEIVTNGRYDAASGAVVFTTNHFSKYAVGYNQVKFNDVKDSAWYGDAVAYLAAREITGGSGNGNFSPDATLTRSQFITLLMRAYGIAPDANPTDNFSDAGDTYYTGYLAAAKRLGISNGVGDNQFAPEQAITRQDMFTLLYNSLNSIRQLPAGDSGQTLSDFADSGSIPAYAQEAMAYLVKTGTVSGSGDKLDPTATTTRAQMTQVLYSLLGK